MKQLIQSYKTGELGLFEIPAPLCNKNGILVRTTASLVSTGTEKMIVDLARKSILGKAKARPDLVKQVINKMKQEGIKNTLEKVFNKLDTPIPLGYSCAGRIIDIGENVAGFSCGDRVASGGAGYANHSEINYVPKNLFIRVPDNVDDTEAAFVTVGAIALQGVRQAEPTLGEKIAVIGLGLLGQLTVQLLKANGCKVLGVDLDTDKVKLAKELGADITCQPEDIINASSELSCGYGVDSVIITASTSSNQPIVDAGEIVKFKGKVVVVGMVGMDVPRNLYYKKELDVRLSMAYGPGRYDPGYEEKGIDYPYPFVRWTEQRNFEAFLGLVSEGKVNPKKLITHQFEFNESLKAYDLLEGKAKEMYLGIILTYQNKIDLSEHKRIEISDKTIPAGKINIGLIGAGNFTKAVLLPHINKLKDFHLVGLCTATGVSASSTGKKFGFKYITTDSEEIFTNTEINSLFVTTRHNDHADKVLKAIENRKHIFVEKPLCIKEEELERIKEAYNELSEKTVLQVGFNRRFSPLIQQMKTVVGDGCMAIHYRVNAGVIPKEVWIQDAEIGGGRIIGEVCHFIDTCSFLTGSEPVTVYANCIKKEDKSIPDEDNVHITINYSNGSIATIGYYAYGNKQMKKEYIELFANGISMQMNDFRELVVFKDGGKKKIRSSNQDKGFQAELDAFAEAIKTGKPAINFNSLYNTTKATFKALESIRSGKPVNVD